MKRIQKLLRAHGLFLLISLILSIPASFNLFTSENAIWILGRETSMKIAILWTPTALVLILLITCIVNKNIPNDDNGWNNGGDDDDPKGPDSDPDPDSTKKLVEKVILESKEKLKNPSPV